LNARYFSLACVLASACSFVVGTNKYVVGGGDDSGGEDATVAEAGDDGGINDAAPIDVAPDVPPCSAAGCIAEAGVCGTNCGVVSANCISNCTNTPCKNTCMTQEAACRKSCGANCYACTVSANCPDQNACNDAAAM
jgi:hypothetical protein